VDYSFGIYLTVLYVYSVHAVHSLVLVTGLALPASTVEEIPVHGRRPQAIDRR